MWVLAAFALLVALIALGVAAAVILALRFLSYLVDAALRCI